MFTLCKNQPFHLDIIHSLVHNFDLGQSILCHFALVLLSVDQFAEKNISLMVVSTKASFKGDIRRFHTNGNVHKVIKVGHNIPPDILQE